jgi:hypothetical protein
MIFLTGAHPSEGGGVEMGTAQFGKASNPVDSGRLRVTNLHETLRCYFGISSSSEFKCCILLCSFGVTRSISKLVKICFTTLTK